MSTQWTNKFAIMKDLSVAQGRDVPVDIEGTVAADEKPPALNLTEETEEEFFHHGAGDGYVDTAPDLGLIKQMLDLVRDKNISSDEEDNSDPVVISKLNPLTAEISPLDTIKTSTPIPNSTPSQNGGKVPKKKANRNCAVASLLQAIEDEKTRNEEETKLKVISDDVPLRLLRPDDFISVTPEVAESVEKVNGWLNTHTVPVNKDSISPVQKKSPVKLSLESMSMFKRKGAEKVKNPVIEETVVKSLSPQNCGTYKPSTLANEYYQKYVERNKLNESLQDDIWTKAEKKMKEIDAKRKLEASKSPSSSIQESEGTIQSPDKLDAVRLPQHRHLLTGECVVCSVICKNGIKSEN